MTSNNNSDVGGIDTAKLDPNRPLASYIDPVAPSVPAIVNLRLSFLECAERMMDRFAVLELTHIERKLKSEVEALVAYATDPRVRHRSLQKKHKTRQKRTATTRRN